MPKVLRLQLLLVATGLAKQTICFCGRGPCLLVCLLVCRHSYNILFPTCWPASFSWYGVMFWMHHLRFWQVGKNEEIWLRSHQQINPFALSDRQIEAVKGVEKTKKLTKKRDKCKSKSTNTVWRWVFFLIIGRPWGIFPFHLHKFGIFSHISTFDVIFIYNSVVYTSLISEHKGWRAIKRYI